jgi:hypothetical protein
MIGQFICVQMTPGPGHASFIRREVAQTEACKGEDEVRGRTRINLRAVQAGADTQDL